jgi:diketogulonate reductase-like aldo/keto reductase
MPALGFGVFQKPPAERIESVATALRTGYRQHQRAPAGSSGIPEA